MKGIIEEIPTETRRKFNFVVDNKEEFEYSWLFKLSAIKKSLTQKDLFYFKHSVTV